MQQITNKSTRSEKILGIILLCLLVAAISYGFGYFQGEWHVIHQCFQYPFLLLDPNQYMACPISPF